MSDQIVTLLDSMPEWAPSTADVAAEIRARVKNGAGVELTDFANPTNPDDPNDLTKTEPTRQQVLLLITKSVRDVTAKIGSLESCTADNIADLRLSAKSAAAIRTAMRIERTYFPEQIGSDRSPYNALSAEFTDEMKTLVEAVAESCGGGGGESVGGGPGVLPSSSFPEEFVEWDTAAW